MRERRDATCLAGTRQPCGRGGATRLARMRCTLRGGGGRATRLAAPRERPVRRRNHADAKGRGNARGVGVKARARSRASAAAVGGEGDATARTGPSCTRARCSFLLKIVWRATPRALEGAPLGRGCGYTGVRRSKGTPLMGIQFAAARAVSAVSTWGLKNVFHRPAANFPGKMALYVDPRLIADLRPKLRKGSFVVVGTNGKTTVTNLLADILEQAGQRVVCNRTGANLDSGVATALLHAKPSDWACSRATSCGWRRYCRICRPATWCCSTCSATSWIAWARSTVSRTASRALSKPRRTRCFCTTPTTRCAPPSPRAWAMRRWRSDCPRAWDCRRTRWPTRRCANSAPP